MAGSGKTTTILKALNIIPLTQQVLYLAFNKDIVKSVKEKNGYIPNVDFKTLHGYGNSVLLEYNNNIKIDNYKYSKMLKSIYDFIKSGDLDIIKEYNFTDEQINSMYVFEIDEIEKPDTESKLRKRIIHLCNLGRLMLISEEKDLIETAKRHGIEILYNEPAIALQLISFGEQYLKSIDFTDMIYLPVKLQINGIKYNWIFIDECQDLNVCQRELMLMALKDNGRFIAVGDPFQAIYGFAGADTVSFKNLVEYPNTKELPLSVCYRCGKKIIEVVKELVPHIEHFEKNEDGVVDYEASQKNITPGDMVLCRNTYPLIKMCFDFLKKGIPATIRGRDIGANIIQMIEDTKKDRIDEMFVVLYSDLEKIKNKLIRKHKITPEEAEDNELYQNQKERIEIIELLGFGVEKPSDISKKINDMFSDDNTGGVQLSTIHKAKGLENEKVFIIHEELMPSKYANQDWQLEQEQNLRYVAYTRAKNYLGFVIDFNAYKDKSKYDKSKLVKDFKQPSFISKPGESVYVTLTVINKKEIKTSKGGTIDLWNFRDEVGNVYTKFGSVPFHFYDEYRNKPLDCYVTIKEHREYNDVKQNVLSKIMLASDIKKWEEIKKNQIKSLTDLFEEDGKVLNNKKDSIEIVLSSYNENGIKEEIDISELDNNNKNLSPEERIGILREAIEELVSNGIKPTIAQLNRKTSFTSSTVKKYLKIIEEMDSKL